MAFLAGKLDFENDFKKLASNQEMCLRHFGINSKMTWNICFNLMSSTSSQDIQLCSSIEKDTAFKLIEISKEPLKLFWMRENREEGKSFQRMGLLLEGAYQWEMGF